MAVDAGSDAGLPGAGSGRGRGGDPRRQRASSPWARGLVIVNPTRLLDACAGRPVLVVGEAMLDVYLVGTASRLCPEGPVPVVDVDHESVAPGGAANTALNAAALGGRVTFLSVLADDDAGALVRRLLEERGVATDALLVGPDRRTLAKTRLVANSQIVARFDRGSTTAIEPHLEAELVARLRAAWHDAAAVVVSDYGYGLLTPRVVSALADLQTADRRVLVVDGKR